MTGCRLCPSIRLPYKNSHDSTCIQHDPSALVDSGSVGNWAAGGDFLLVRVGARGEPVELTSGDLGLWEILLGLDDLMRR